MLPSSFPLRLDTELPSKVTRGKIIALNTIHAPRREVVKVPLSSRTSFARLLKEEVVQVSKDGQTGFVMVDDSMGAGFSPITGMYANSTGAHAFKSEDGSFVLKNANVEMKISGGRIVSLYDVTLERELIPKGKSGGLVIFDDRPNYWLVFGAGLSLSLSRRSFNILRTGMPGMSRSTTSNCAAHLSSP